MRDLRFARKGSVRIRTINSPGHPRENARNEISRGTRGVPKWKFGNEGERHRRWDCGGYSVRRDGELKESTL